MIIMKAQKQQISLCGRMYLTQKEPSHTNKSKKSNFHYACSITVLRRSAQQVTGPISAAERLGNIATKKRRNVGEPLATLCPI